MNAYPTCFLLRSHKKTPAQIRMTNRKNTRTPAMTPAENRHKHSTVNQMKNWKEYLSLLNMNFM